MVDRGKIGTMLLPLNKETRENVCQNQTLFDFYLAQLT